MSVYENKELCIDIKLIFSLSPLGRAYIFEILLNGKMREYFNKLNLVEVK